MSAKSNHSNGTENQNARNLPEVDNSDFIAEPDAEQIYETVNPQDESGERNRTYSFGSNAYQDFSNDMQTEVKNVQQSESSSIPERQSIEIEPVIEMPTPNEPPDVNPNSATISSSNFDSVNNIESISAKIEGVSNSLYDSNEKLVFSRSTSEYSGSVGEQTNLWKNLLMGIMIPYMVVGVPVTSIIQLAQKPDRISSAKQWLKFLFSTTTAMVINSFEIFLVLLLNLYIVYIFVGPLYTLLVDGQMTEHLISMSVHLYEIIPLIVGLNIVWFRGFYLSNIIRILDIKVATKDSDSTTKACMSLTKTAVAYGSLVLLTLSSMVSFEWKSANYFATESRFDFYYHLVAHFYLFLLIPVYLSIISGLHYRIGSLNTYIRSMSEDLTSITLQDFQRVKNVFKQNADVVCKVNFVFNLLLSDILLIVIISILKDIFQTFMLVAALDSITISLEKGSRQVDPEMMSKATKWVALDSFVVLAKCTLIAVTAKKIKATNREIKRILSNLHDLASQYIEKPSEIYQSFCLVKYYIKARNERSDNPAVLRLYAAKWIPCIKI